MATQPTSGPRPTTCPCGQLGTLIQCCGPIIANERPAMTAEELMRSRYSAFALGQTEPALDAAAHLLRSWDPDTRPGHIGFEPGRVWTGLEVVATEGGGALDATGIVHFRASFTDSGSAETLTERSSFRRVDGRWVYVAGIRP